MTASRDPDRLISAFLDEGLTELPDRAYDRVREHIDHTRQRVVIGPWREPHMTSIARLGLAAAIILGLTVAGLNLFRTDSSVGVDPTSSPTQATPTRTPAPTSAPTGILPAGTHETHPFPESNPELAVTFTVPAGWEAGEHPSRRMVGVVPPAGHEPPDGGAVGFLIVDSLNTDPCTWLSDTDIEIGPTARDLVTALAQHPALETTAAVDVTLGGWTGKRIDVLMPTDIFTGPTSSVADGCDERAYRIWNAEAFDIYAQGPGSRWHITALDVDGTRVVILAFDYPGTSAEDQAAIQAVVDSVRIEP